MTVGLHEFNVYLATVVVTSIICIILPVWRLYILRHKTRNKLFVWSEAAYSVAWLINTMEDIRRIITMAQERSIRRDSPSEIGVVVKYMKVEFFQWEFANVLTAVTVLWLIKVAFLLFYWNLTSGTYEPGHRVRVALFTTALSLAGSYVAIIVVFLTYCKPMSLNWNLDALMQNKLCSPYYAFYPQTMYLVLNLLTDLMVLGIPLLLVNTILKQSLSRIEKQILPLIFIIGVLSVVATLVRYCINMRKGYYRVDPTPITLQVYHLGVVLSELEMVCAFIAFAMPAFRFLLATTWASRTRSRSKSSHGGSGSGGCGTIGGGDGNGGRRVYRENRGEPGAGSNVELVSTMTDVDSVHHVVKTKC